MASPALSQINFPEAFQHSLDELGIRDVASVENLFTQVKKHLEHELGGVSVTSVVDLEALRVNWLGRNQGILRSISENWLRSAPKELKPAVGAGLNSVRKEAERLISAIGMCTPLAAEVVDRTHGRVTVTSAVADDTLDITLPGTRRATGSRHPLRIVMEDVTEIFFSLGYSVEEGPEIESTYFNFEALNIPEDHPARDDQDTFYIDPKTVLRTHTSPVQVRTMQRQQPPVRIIVPGKAYRHDAPDATHSPVFHQVEGLAVGTNISLADLKGTLDYFLKAFFGPTVRTRLRPSFFPFTEPSAEVDMSCLFCGGDSSGCRICKQSGWIELGGCGMVDPVLYSYVKYDSAKYSGFAFGMGLERLAMLKYGIPDIQLFYQSDIRFLHQFR